MRIAIGLVLVIQVCFVLGAGWLGGSLITSGIKAGFQHCGQKYPIELVFNGDFFCPKK